MGYLEPVDTTISIIERVGLLDKLLLKFISSSKKAWQSLAEALNEIEKSTTALRDALLAVSNISVVEPVTSDVAKELDNLASGVLEISVQKAKGSCHRIGEIYDTYLSGILSNLVQSKFLNSTEVGELEGLFYDLSKSDASFLEIAQIISGRLREVSESIRTHLENKDSLKAKEIISALHNESIEKAKRLNAVLVKMIELQGEFAKKSGSI